MFRGLRTWNNYGRRIIACPQRHKYQVLGATGDDPERPDLAVFNSVLLGQVLLVIAQPIWGITVAIACAYCTGWERVPGIAAIFACLPLICWLARLDASLLAQLPIVLNDDDLRVVEVKMPCSHSHEMRSAPNLALGRSAAQSSDYIVNSWCRPASNAVDGDTADPEDPDGKEHLMSHTCASQQEWWEVDLGEDHDIGIVLVYTRNACRWRLWPFNLLVSSTVMPTGNLAEAAAVANHVVRVTGPDPFSYRLSTVTVNGRGRYVRVHLEEVVCLHLCQVEIYPPGAALFLPSSSGSAYNQIEDMVDSEKTFDVTIKSLLVQDAQGSVFPPPFITSKLEALDATSDGVAIVAVALLERDPIWQARLHLSLSSVPIFREFIAYAGMHALMGYVLLAASLVQLGMSLLEDRWDFVVAHHRADLAGLGATLQRVKKYTDPSCQMFRHMRFMVHFGRVTYESAFQLAAQASCVIASGNGLLAQPILFFSILLTTGLGLQKTMEMVKHATQEDSCTKERVMFISAATITGSVFIWMICCVLLSESCPSKMWYVTCVEVPDDLLV